MPQEMVNEGFESVLSSVRFSRGLFGKPPAPELLEQILRDLSLWNKRDDATMTLSGGMRRRVMIAKALAHEPQVLFLWRNLFGNTYTDTLFVVAVSFDVCIKFFFGSNSSHDF